MTEAIEEGSETSRTGQRVATAGEGDRMTDDFCMTDEHAANWTDGETAVERTDI